MAAAARRPSAKYRQQVWRNGHLRHWKIGPKVVSHTRDVAYVGSGEACVASEVDARDAAFVARHDRLEHALPDLDAVDAVCGPDDPDKEIKGG